ncbi:VOC family protein [Qipengyuania qiaonensis]|uniref:VOC family protein n=1 Tax=Qipengyuania qiaonensis TaxID=2867240 RepID=A0ABS7J701_9SPHN|nr:VOC family protein [Qipengyuania qiaonensis]MBX7483097.1 VOC family protein [Qipengyuania qiaonensis]
MADKQGDFVWYELMTTDADAAQEFYAPLLGWSFEDADFDNNGYRAFSAGETQVGGFLPLTAEMTAGGARPAWLGYIRVDDVPATLADIRERGGQVMVEGVEVPGIGPFAMITDPHGAPFYIIDDRSGQDSGAFARYEPQQGCCAWNELASDNPAQSDAFYTGLFGWTKGEAMEMGPLGTYQMYSHPDYMIVAIYPKMPEDPQAHWLYYFRVPDIDAAVEQIDAGGGRIHQQPTEIPGGEFSLAGIDPQGSFFGLVGPRK